MRDHQMMAALEAEGLSVRAAGALCDGWRREWGWPINHAEVAKLNSTDILAMPNLGRKSFREIEKWLLSNETHFKDMWPYLNAGRLRAGTRPPRISAREKPSAGVVFTPVR